MADAAAGVFETLLVRDGKIQALDRHLDRLLGSVSEVYGASLPGDLASRARRRAAGLTGEHRLRIDAAPTSRGVEVALVTSPLDPRRPASYRCVPLILTGGQGAHKWRDRARLASPPGSAAVPLLIDADGSVLEAAWANFWILGGQALITPPADGRILPGVTRARLLELAPPLGLDVVERPISLAQARAAPAALLTSSLALAVSAAVEAEPALDPDAAELVAAIRARLASGEFS
jgi:para-aminobenzoate synthetase/4-amino-4-deoxychorismate lyase